MKKLARLFLSVQPFPFKRWLETDLIIKDQTGLLFLEFNDAKNILTFVRRHEAEKMVFPLNVMFQIYKTAKKGCAIYRNFSKFGCGFAVFDISVPDFSSFLFCIEILNPFLSTSKVPFELNEKPKLYCRILNKLEVICLTWNGLYPKVKKEKKKIIKTGYHAFVYLGIQTARNKLGKQINCPRSLKSKSLLSVQEDY